MPSRSHTWAPSCGPARPMGPSAPAHPLSPRATRSRHGPPGSLGSPTLHLLHTAESSASATWLPPLTSFGRFLLRLTRDARPTSRLSRYPLLARPPASDTCATASCLWTTLHTRTGDVPEPPSISFWLLAIHHIIISIRLTKAWNLWLLDGLPPCWLTHSSGPGVPCGTRHHTGTPRLRERQPRKRGQRRARVRHAIHAS